MTTRRAVAERLKRLKSDAVKSQTTLNMAEIMLRGLADSEEISCTVDQGCRTRIFDFPGARAVEPVRWLSVYESRSVRAHVVCDLESYFEESESTHYAISPALRCEVNAKSREVGAQRDGAYPCLVIEEDTKIAPVVLDRGCVLTNEVCYRNGKRTPLLKGGRDNEKFILAMRSSDGKWPDISTNEQTVMMVLAAVRASQNAHDEIRKHVDQNCLITDDGRYVCPLEGGSASMRATVASNLNAQAFSDKAGKIKAAIAWIERDLQLEHIELLVNALYWDDYKDDDFRRLHYLSLWQSLAECRRKLGYVAAHASGKLKDDTTVVAGSRSLAELTAFRDDIAHWWKGSMDGNYLADIYSTINELIRRKYFR